MTEDMCRELLGAYGNNPEILESMKDLWSQQLPQQPMGPIDK